MYRACLEVCPWEKLMAKAGLGIFSVVSTKVSAHPEGSSGAGVKPGYQVFAIHLDQSFDGSFCPGGSMTPGEVLLFIRGQFPEVVPPPHAPISWGIVAFIQKQGSGRHPMASVRLFLVVYQHE